MNINELSLEQREAILNGDFNNEVLTKINPISEGNGAAAEGIFEIIDYEGFNSIFMDNNMNVNEDNDSDYICEVLDLNYTETSYIISYVKEDILQYLCETFENEGDFESGQFDLYNLNGLYIMID